MGEKSKKLQRFLTNHPLCCFCGGETVAVSEDHIPARGLFLGRLWPEGYVFPACLACNNGSSRDEFLLAWLVRVRLADYSPVAEADFERTCVELSQKAPDVWGAIKIHSRLETRRLQKLHELPKFLPGVSDVVHSFEIPEPMMDAAVRYGSKLGKALYYLHAKQIVPANAVVKTRVFTNATAMSPSFPEQVFAVLTQDAPIRRERTSLKEQFDYRYAVVEDG